MSDEIYVNIGTSFQQPYQGQGLAQGRTPVIAQYIARKPANAQTPFTYQNRQPASARQPSSAQTPYIANRQTPSIVQATANYPYIASAQQSYPYIANAQTTTQNTGRTPVIYQATGRTPFTYARQGQTPYSATGRLPSTYETQGQTPYSFQQSYQQTYETQGTQPYTFNDTGRQPTIYQAQGTQPYSYQQNYQTPSIYTAQVSTNSQATYQHPTTYQHQAQITYRHPTSSQSVFQTPVIAQQPYQHPYTAQTPASKVGRQPTTYTYPDPAIWGPYPYTGDTYTAYTYTFSGYRDGNVYAPQEFGLDFGSTGAPVTPSIYDTEGWYTYVNPYTSGYRTLYIQGLSHPNNITPTNVEGYFVGGTNNQPPAGTSIYWADITYFKITTPAGTTNVPKASMTFLYPGAPGLSGNGYTLLIPTPSMPTYVLGSGQTGSLGCY
jgi:hypothetical protein